MIEEMNRKPDLTLMERGNYFVGECPFNDSCGKDAFCFSKEQRRFYCFGCHKGGTDEELNKFLKEKRETSKNG
jgi:DNA primase